ncbi:hypothetical protein BUY49_10645, partial [Staphylococcus devriesei]
PILEEKEVYEKEYEDYIKNTLNILSNINDDNAIEEIENFIYNLNQMREKYVRKTIKISNQQYTGPWLDYIRDIDPTLLLLEIRKESKKLLPNQPTSKWITENNTIEETELFLEIDIYNKKYISLVSSFSYENKSNDNSAIHKNSFHLFAMGYFFDEENSNQILQKSNEEYANGINVPQSYNVFLYEHYWSSSYQDYLNERGRDLSELREIAIHNYTWELDNSLKEKSISFYIPSEKIINYFSLEQVEEGIWQNLNGEKICLNTKLLGFDNECLLIDKEKLLTFLKDNNISIGWQIYLDKMANKARKEWWYNVFYSNGMFEKYISKTESTS